MPESLPVALSHLLNSNVNEFTKSLVIDCDGTTLDMDVAIRDVYATLGERVVSIENPQSALSREICLYHSDAGAQTVEEPLMAEVGDDA